MKLTHMRGIRLVLLLAVLVGVPLACASLAGYDDVLGDVFTLVPRTDDWQERPERLWNCRRPFAWWAFALVGACGCAMVCPFVCRAFRLLFRTRPPSEGRVVARYPLWGWLGVGLTAAGWVVAWTRLGLFASVQRFTYIPLWTGFIVAMNALVYRRSGRSPLTHETGRYLMLFPVSAAFWWFFEYLNRYVWNWFYVNVQDMSPLTYVMTATISFSTVLPGILAVAEWLGTFRFFSGDSFANMMRVNVRSWPVEALMAVGSAIGLVGIVFIPEFAYPFLWISPFLVVVLIEVLFKRPCALDDVATGNWSRIVRFAVASLLCGLLWEMWNAHSFTKWIYAVPYVHRFQYFEMPLLGLFGYIPFGIECLVITDSLMQPAQVRLSHKGTQTLHERSAVLP